MYLLTANWGLLENENDTSIFSIRDDLLNLKGEGVRECDSMSAAGAQIRRSLGHHLLHLLILRFLVLCAPANIESQNSLL